MTASNLDDEEEISAYEPDAEDEGLLDTEEGCTRCGMNREAWGANGGKGVSMGGDRYCCDGCAEETGCTCEEEKAAADAPPKRKRGRAAKSR